MKKIYIKKHPHNANKWIYDGYASAWQHCGFDVAFFDSYEDIQDNNYYLMTTDWTITNDNSLNVIKKSIKTFLFVQPTKYEMPWASHPNFVCTLPENYINEINSMSNVHKWTFVDFERCDFYTAWNKIYKYPLAFDSLAYNNFQKDNKYNFDICYVGGRAHNGFDEKYKIMLKTFSAFMNTKLKCGFFIEKNLSHEQEKNIIYNSKICLNVHDANQLKLNLDTNERTFKSLGINGALVCSNNGQLNRLFPDIRTGSTPEEIANLAIELCNNKNLNSIKQNNKENIIKNHTYVARVKSMMEYI